MKQLTPVQSEIHRDNMSTEKVCKIFNEAFGKPFLPAGFVEAKVVFKLHDKPYINLRIGSRDVSFTLDGEWFGQGTDLVSKWSDLVNSLAGT